MDYPSLNKGSVVTFLRRDVMSQDARLPPWDATPIEHNVTKDGVVILQKIPTFRDAAFTGHIKLILNFAVAESLDI
jgi:hypothetical protein